MRAPDVAGEIAAYRAWYLDVDWRGNVRLVSLNGVPWPPGAWMVAACSRCDESPGERCTCGIYAARDRAHLCSMGYNQRYGDVLIGKVGLAGKVVVGDQGWRAEKARPLHLCVPYDDWQLAKPLRDTYGCAVSLSNVLLSEEVPHGHRA